MQTTFIIKNLTESAIDEVKAMTPRDAPRRSRAPAQVGFRRPETLRIAEVWRRRFWRPCKLEHSYEVQQGNIR